MADARDEARRRIAEVLAESYRWAVAPSSCAHYAAADAVLAVFQPTWGHLGGDLPGVWREGDRLRRLVLEASAEVVRRA